MRYLLACEVGGIKLYAQDCLAYKLAAMDTAYKFSIDDANAIRNRLSANGIEMLLEDASEEDEEDDCFAVSFLDLALCARLYIPVSTEYEFTPERLLGQKFSYADAVGMLTAFYPADKVRIEYVPEWDWRQKVLVADYPNVLVVK